MGKLIILPGVFRPDLEEQGNPEGLLRHAATCNLRDVAIVGRSIDGSLWTWFSQADPDAAAGLLMRAVHWIADPGTSPVSEKGPDTDGAA